MGAALIGSVDDPAIDPGGSEVGPLTFVDGGQHHCFAGLLAIICVGERTIGNDGVCCVANVFKHCSTASIVVLISLGVDLVPVELEVLQVALTRKW